MSDHTQAEQKSLSVMTYLSGTGRRLLRWEKAGLIDRTQLCGILDYEKAHNGRRLMRSLFGIALMAIALGILSIIAANWMHIPGEVKIGAHFILNVAVAAFMWKFAKVNNKRADNKYGRDGMTVLFFALNLTLIVLIGQVYQLHGNYAAALSLWMLISTPAVFVFGHSALAAVPWVLAFLGTLAAVLYDFTDRYDLDSLPILLVWLATGLYVPLVMIAASAADIVRKYRAEWAPVLFRVSMIIFAVEATCGSFYWYSDLSRDLVRTLNEGDRYLMNYLMMLAVIVSAPLAVYGFEWLKTRQGKKIIDRTGIVFAIGSMISATLPFIILAREADFVAALHFCAYWAFAGWIGARMNYTQLINAAVTLVTLRIIVIYFELFGGLMLTGFGLIFSGLLTLAILKGSLKVREQIINAGKQS